MNEVTNQIPEFNEVTNQIPEFYEEFSTVAVHSNETATMNDSVATMNDLVIMMGGVDSFNQYESPDSGIVKTEKP